MTRPRLTLLTVAVLALALTQADCRRRPPDDEKPPPPPPEFALDHFKVYEVERQEVEFKVLLSDQLGAKPAVLVALTHFANPTRKRHPGAEVGIKDVNAHLTWYLLNQEEPEPRRTVRFRNQFGQSSVDIRDPRFLLVPTQKVSHQGSAFPEKLDHYKCYDVTQINTVPPPPPLVLGDQFGTEDNVQVGPPRLFCIPAKKEREGHETRPIVNEKDHLAVYEIVPQPQEREIKTLDQFGEWALRVTRSVWLAVPTEKQVVVAHDN